ncbi:MAG: DUF402 domain-containing protein [Spirochaetota bacterium]
MKQAYTVYKLNEHGVEKLHYPATCISHDAVAGHITVEAIFSIDSADGGAFRLQKGDRMVEYFFSDRYYNVFEVSDPDGSLKGYYCNITRPASISESEIRADDLALDISVDAAGNYRVLDREEFDALSLSESERAAALEAADSLIDMISRASWPFHRLRHPR